MKEITIHIGTGKTGSTSIQNVLARRRAALRAVGVLYPQTLGPTNHEAAAVCAADYEPGFTPRKARGVGSPSALEDFRSRMREKLANEIEASGCQHLVISNEHLFEKVRTSAQAQRVVELIGLDRVPVRIVVYLRPQADMAAAVYAELLRMGSAPEYATFLRGRRVRDLLDYEGGISAWASVFGDSALRVRVFERSRLVAGDVLADFVSVTGIDPTVIAPGPDIAGVAESRRSFDAPTVAFLDRFNGAVLNLLSATGEAKVAGKFRSLPHRRMIVGCIEALEKQGPRFAFDSQTVASITEAHADANARVFERFGIEPFAKPTMAAGSLRPRDHLDVDHAFELFARFWIEAMKTQAPRAE